MFEYIKREREGPVTIITINRPEVLNALHMPANQELSRVFDEFAADSSQWVAIITGAGERAFSAGNDLRYQTQIGKFEAPPTGMAGLTGRFDLHKPVIAAVNGLAMGGGFEVALACDIIVAAPHATFALPEPRVGLAALGGGLHRLPRSVGFHRAMSMILTSASVTATQALELGFVAQVAPTPELIGAARTLAARICEASPASIKASKEIVLSSLGVGFAEAAALQGDLPGFRAMWASPDSKEGPRAFSEKRKPVWAS